jgi:bile acid:Na+ symporter, BASS family
MLIVTVDQALNVVVTITLIEMMAAVGLGVPFSDLVRVAKDMRLTAMALVANYVCVPLAAVALLLLFKAEPLVAAGFLIVAVCPGAPFSPPCTAIAKGNVAVSVGLMVVLAASSAIVAPLLLGGLLPLFAGSASLRVDPVKLVVTLLFTQLLPLSVGLAVRHWHPALAGRLQKPANRLSALLNLVVVSFILAAQFQMLTAIPARAWAGMSGLLLASLVAGWLLGGPGVESRRAMSLTTSLRNVGVGLVIATNSFPGTPAVTATLAYGLFEIAGSLFLAVFWGRVGAIRDLRPLAAAGSKGVGS